MTKIIPTLFSVFAIHLIIYGQIEAKTNDGKNVLFYENGARFYADSVWFNKSITKLELPQTNSKDKIISHAGYSLSYNETHEQANWIAYVLTKEETNKLFNRTNKFLSDPMVDTGTASQKDYEKSGYDRGHLAPASDMSWSAAAMAESFYYSNISPQTPSFNRGIWKNLEGLVRTWAIENKTIYIATGPVLTNTLQSIGPNKVSVPNYFYKVILDYTKPSIKGIGFILSNSGSKEKLQKYAVSIDSVEELTGIDFFPLLPDSQEELIEKSLCINCWSWKNIKTKREKNESKTTESVQCSGTTRTGKRCKRMTKSDTGRCYQH
jgi:endonuclease G